MIRDAAESATPPAIAAGAGRSGGDDAAQASARRWRRARDLLALIDAAHGRDLPWLLDDEVLTLGAGIGHIDLPLDALPPVADIALAVAPRRAHRRRHRLERQDHDRAADCRLCSCARLAHRLQLYRRAVPRRHADHRAGTIRGRSALARCCATDACRRRCSRPRAAGFCAAVSPSARRSVAVVTNVSSDHFGEYGIHDLDALAEVKLVRCESARRGRAAGGERRRPAAARARRRDRAAARLVRARRGRSAAHRASRAGRSDRGRARRAARGRAPRRGGRPRRRSLRCRSRSTAAPRTTSRISPAPRSRHSRSGSPPRPSRRCTHASVRTRATTRAG